MKQYYVYLMSSFRQTLYVGVTNDLYRRVYQHKTKAHPNSFTARYNINRLVYYEVFNNINDALAREKQIKSWRRSKKNCAHRSRKPKVEGFEPRLGLKTRLVIPTNGRNLTPVPVCRVRFLDSSE